MKKKPKFIFKVNRNKTAKVYINNKWLKDVVEINIKGRPYDYRIEVRRYKRENGRLVVNHDEIETYTTLYTIKKD